MGCSLPWKQLCLGFNTCGHTFKPHVGSSVPPVSQGVEAHQHPRMGAMHCHLRHPNVDDLELPHLHLRVGPSPPVNPSSQQRSPALD